MRDVGRCLEMPSCTAVGIEIPSGVVLNKYDNPLNFG